MSDSEVEIETINDNDTQIHEPIKPEHNETVTTETNTQDQPTEDNDPSEETNWKEERDLLLSEINMLRETLTKPKTTNPKKKKSSIKSKRLKKEEVERMAMFSHMIPPSFPPPPLMMPDPYGRMMMEPPRYPSSPYPEMFYQEPPLLPRRRSLLYK